MQHDTVLAMRALRIGLLLIAPLLLFAQSSLAQSGTVSPAHRNSAVLPSEFAHTFSIVARDAKTGEIGVAVQSHWFAVGQTVPWAEAGVGAVATQSFIDPTYGARGLELMRTGRQADEALVQLLMDDPARNVRQVAMIDAKGDAAAWTGAKCIPPAGDIVGQQGMATRSLKLPNAPQDGVVQIGARFSVQANLMSNDRIWPAMAKAFQETDGDLAARMLAALDAAQAAGGDIRGRQSAALIVVKGTRSETPWKDRVFDLRVDDADYPLKELRRLVTLQRAYNHMNAGDLATEKHDNAGALREYGAAEQMVPDNAEMIYWHAAALVNMGKVDEALPLFKRCFALDANWATLTPRLPAVGLLPNDPAVIAKIEAQAK